MVYLFALLAPIFLGLAAIVLSVGNWYVHKRHLQTQVDASVLAAAPTFANCFFDPTVANAGVVSDAIPYSGDTARSAAQSSTAYNQQLQTPSHTHVIYNSGSRYWQQSDGTDPSKGGTDPTKSYGGLDNSAGAPCMVSYLEAHATDDRAPLLFPWFLAHPSPKTRARVEIRQIENESGMLPIAVPEIDPAAVYAIFVDYSKDGTQSVTGFGTPQPLIKDSTSAACPPGGSSFPYACWHTSAGYGDVNTHPDSSFSRGIGVVILVSKNTTTPSMSGTLNQVCNQAPGLVQCYAGTGSDYDGSATRQGLTFVHSFNDVFGSLMNPAIRDVNVTGTTCGGGVSPGDLSSPYFTNDDNDCSAIVNAVVGFGSGWLGQPGNPSNDPTKKPNQGGICASVGSLTWQSTDPGTGFTHWTGSISIPSDGGPQALNLTASDKPSGSTCNNPPNSTAENPATAPYSADDAAGPVDYVHLDAATGSCAAPGSTVADANSVPDGSYCYSVAVGLDQPLALKPWNSADILLRFGSKALRKSGTGNVNGALECDHGIPLATAFANGCRTTYGLNYDDWDNNPMTPNTWKDLPCNLDQPGEYAGALPPLQFVNNPPPICVAPKPGVVQALQTALAQRFESPCTPNYWPATQAQADQFFKPVSQGGHDFTNDKRYVTLIVTDNTAFQKSKGGGGGPVPPVPVKYFAGFYVTGWDLGGPKANGCPDPDGGGPLRGNDCHPLLSTPTTPGPPPSTLPGCSSYKKSLDDGDIWGHFVKFVVFSASGTPSKNVCDLTSSSPETCIAVLTR